MSTFWSALEAGRTIWTFCGIPEADEVVSSVSNRLETPGFLCSTSLLMSALIASKS